MYKATEIHTKTEVAVKVVNLHEISIKDIEHLKREIYIHTRLQHPNIVKIYEEIWTEKHAYIFMELVRGVELFDHLNRHGPLP